MASLPRAQEVKDESLTDTSSDGRIREQREVSRTGWLGFQNSGLRLVASVLDTYDKGMSSIQNGCMFVYAIWELRCGAELLCFSQCCHRVGKR